MAVSNHYKKKLGVDKLNPNKRSEMFTKFRRVGGKVIEIKEDEAKQKALKLQSAISGLEIEYEEGLSPAERKKQESAARVRQKLKKYGSNTATIASSDVSSAEKNAEKKAKKTGRFSLWMAKLMCRLYGAMRFFGNKISRTFLYILTERVRSVLEGSKRILVSLIYQDGDVAMEIKRRLDAFGLSYHYELIYRFYHLLEEADLTALEKIKTYRADQLNKGKSTIIKIYKQLFTLKKQQSALKDAIQKGLRIEMEIRKLSQDILVNNIQILFRNIDFLYQTVFPRLQLLIEYFYKEEQNRGIKKKFAQFLSYAEQDRIGYYTRQWKEKEEAEKRKKELEEALVAREKEQKQGSSSDIVDNIELMEGVPDAARAGLLFIYNNLDFDEAMKEIQEEIDKQELLKMSDKILLMIAVLEFFDKQFSFLFATNTVKYNMFMGGGGKRVDLRNAMRDLYYKVNPIYQRVREYVSYLAEGRKLSRSSSLILSQNDPEIQRVNRNLSKLQRMIHAEIKQVIAAFSKILFVVVTDFRANNKILDNGQDTVEINPKLDKLHIFQGKTIGEALEMAYKYTTAFLYLLTDGDLLCDNLELKKPTFLHVPVLSGPKKKAEENFEVTKASEDTASSLEILPENPEIQS